MITISNSDCKLIAEILAAYGESCRSATNLKEWNRGRTSRNLSKKLKKKLPCSTN